MTTPDGEREDAGRRLFHYLHADEWRTYRSIISMFAGTFFAELTPDDLIARMHAAGVDVDPDVVPARLERLRDWGNLAVSASVGNPTSVADYYRLRNRYLITRAGQEVHDLVEGVLAGVDAVTDIAPGRLRALLAALDALAAVDIETVDPIRAADLVRAVFDPHQTFTSEITQFFAEINVWQSRYDLTPEQFTFFAEILIGYVADRLDELERTARPIGRSLQALEPRFAAIASRVGGDLASRVSARGLDNAIDVARLPGSSENDWINLRTWFVTDHGPSRLDRLRTDALAAVRTLTANLTRLSRTGVGLSSKRADFLRLARLLDTARDDTEVAEIAAAALGLHRPVHWGVLSTDVDDPVPTTTAWADAPPAVVAVSIRERGDTTNRGRTTPMADRSAAQLAVAHRREYEAAARQRIDGELLALTALDGAKLSAAALVRLQQLIGRTITTLGVTRTTGSLDDAGVRCTITRAPGTTTSLRTEDGDLVLAGLRVEVEPAGG